jgi:UDP-N-acetylmuramate dehydrogenase
VEAAFRAIGGDIAHIRRTMEASLRRRKRTQPLSMPSAGSVFVNPEGDSAGRLIESAGLQGARVGGAQVSEVHANFIVNAGGATAVDVVALVRLIRDTVKEAYGIELTPEVRFLGPFDGS